MFLIKEGETNWKYVLIVAVVAVIAGSGFLLCVEKSDIKVPEGIIKDETANLKTYRNEIYGFEIKYPSFYDQEKYCRPKMLDKEGIEVIVDGEDPAVFIGPIIITREKSALSLSQYVEQQIQKIIERPAGLVVSKENATLGGREAIKVVSEICGVSCGNPTDIFVKQGEWVLKVDYDDGTINECPFGAFKLPSEIANKILSTFKFIN